MRWNYAWRCINLALTLIVGMNSAQASELASTLSFAPYVGIEYQYQHIKGSGDWAKIMPTSFNNAAVFVGSKIHRNFGLDLDYYQGVKSSTSVANINSFNGLTANAASNVSATLKLKGVGVTGNIYVPLDPNFDFMLVAGVIVVRPQVTISGTGSNLVTALSKVTGKTQTIVRLGIGVEYSEKKWGARTRVLWDNTSRLHLNVANAAANFNSITAKAFKSALTVTAGLFYKF